jgi:hypothetical protein
LKKLRNLQSIPASHAGDYERYVNRRPFIEVSLASTDSQGQLKVLFKTLMLVDSGADNTVLPMGIGVLLLGRDLLNCTPVSYSGVDGKEFHAVEASIAIEICDQWYPTKVYFSLADLSISILWRKGIFDQLNI